MFSLDYADMDKQEIAEKVKNSAYDIIAKKHATYYGIAMSVRRICECIVRDEKSILPISNFPLTRQKAVSDKAHKCACFKCRAVLANKRCKISDLWKSTPTNI